jgi:hypothetical protein
MFQIFRLGEGKRSLFEIFPHYLDMNLIFDASQLDIVGTTPFF